MTTLKGLKRLVGLDTSPYVTLSVYLDVDGRRFPAREFEIVLKDLLRQAEKELKKLPASVRDAAVADLERVDAYVRQDFVRDRTRLLVIFACGPRDLFEVFQLPFSLKSQVNIQTMPYTPPLLMALAGMHDALVVMSDRALARFFLYQSGRLEALGQIRGEVPARARVGGFKGYEAKRIERHIEEHVQWHLKRVVEETRRLDALYDPDLILLSGPAEVVNVLRKLMPSRVLQRLGPDLGIHLDSGGVKEIQEQVESALHQYEIQFQERLIAQIREAVPHQAVVGVEPTLEVMNENRAGTLVFNPEAELKGWKCFQCDYLTTLQVRCPRCGIDLDPVSDLLVEVVDLAVQQGADLVPLRSPVRGSGADFELAALLRY